MNRNDAVTFPDGSVVTEIQPVGTEPIVAFYGIYVDSRDRETEFTFTPKGLSSTGRCLFHPAFLRWCLDKIGEIGK